MSESRVSVGKCLYHYYLLKNPKKIFKKQSLYYPEKEDKLVFWGVPKQFEDQGFWNNTFAMMSFFAGEPLYGVSCPVGMSDGNCVQLVRQVRKTKQQKQTRQKKKTQQKQPAHDNTFAMKGPAFEQQETCKTLIPKP